MRGVQFVPPPLAPVINGLDLGMFSPLLFLCLLGALIFLVVKPMNKTAILTVLAFFFLLVLEDQSRLQPWLYIYSMMLLCSVFFSRRERNSFVFSDNPYDFSRNVFLEWLFKK